MSGERKRVPEVIEDQDLDEANGGGGPHLSEASAQGLHIGLAPDATKHSGGAHIALCDGSVRGVSHSVDSKA